MSGDGIRLHYRDYPGDSAKPPILCLPGLTRNARDFADLAAALAGEWRLICVSLRGRGESGSSKDPMAYVPAVYLDDIERLIADLKLDRFVAFGTSLGGILTMLLAAARPERIAGALLNDIGPRIENSGLARIRTYVGKTTSFPTWLHAARAIAETNAECYPDYAIADWLHMAKRLCRLTSAGRVVFDYDMKIAEPMRVTGAATADLWPGYDALASAPLLIVRGERSDLLSAATAGDMLQRHPSADLVTVARVGHAPTLDEPQVRAGIARLLARIAR